MEDQFNTFFKNTDFDLEEPRFGHLREISTTVKQSRYKEKKNNLF